MLRKDKLVIRNYQIAYQFYECAICYYKAWPNQFDHIPFIVNICFSCELMLKILLHNNNNGITDKDIRKDNHSIFELYNKLDDSYKKQIEDTLKQYNVEQSLEKCNNLFQEARYYYLNALFMTPQSFECEPIFLKKFCEELIRISKEFC